MNGILTIAVGAGVVAILVGFDVALLRRLRQARHDPLTGLPNRELWTSRAENALRRPRGLLLVMCDGDHVKTANDRYGHSAGDALIAALGRRLQEWAGSAHDVGRLGGDEFAACVRLGHGRELAAALDDLSRDLAQPVPYQGIALAGGASVGAVLVEDLADPTLSAALAAADQAMYEAKAERKGGWSWARPAADSWSAAAARFTAVEPPAEIANAIGPERNRRFEHEHEYELAEVR